MSVAGHTDMERTGEVRAGTETVMTQGHENRGGTEKGTVREMAEGRRIGAEMRMMIENVEKSVIVTGDAMSARVQTGHGDVTEVITTKMSIGKSLGQAEVNRHGGGTISAVKSNSKPQYKHLCASDAQ